MAETADDIPNDLIMAMFEIVEAEYHEQFDRDGVIYSENICVWQTFDVMCERFASGSAEECHRVRPTSRCAAHW